MEEDARRKEERRAALEESQRLRSNLALAKERNMRSERALKIEVMKDLRSSILAAEREKASRMADEAERTAAVERDEAEKTAEEEERRKRAHLPSGIDYRFTRLHEGKGGAAAFVEVGPPSGSEILPLPPLSHLGLF